MRAENGAYVQKSPLIDQCVDHNPAVPHSCARVESVESIYRPSTHRTVCDRCSIRPRMTVTFDVLSYAGQNEEQNELTRG